MFPRVTVATNNFQYFRDPWKVKWWSQVSQSKKSKYFTEILDECEGAKVK